jgi:hypothetical protein
VRVSGSHALFALEFNVREHLLRGQRAEFQQDHQELSEVFEHPSRDGGALAARLQWKRSLQIADRQPAMPAIERVERTTDDRSCREDAAHRQAPQHADHSGDGEVFETVTKGNGPVSQ